MCAASSNNFFPFPIKPGAPHILLSFKSALLSTRLLGASVHRDGCLLVVFCGIAAKNNQQTDSSAPQMHGCRAKRHLRYRICNACFHPFTHQFKLLLLLLPLPLMATCPFPLPLPFVSPSVQPSRSRISIMVLLTTVFWLKKALTISSTRYIPPR